MGRWPEPAAVTQDTGPDADDGESVRRRVLALLGAAPVSLDDLVRASGCSARDVSRTVLDLELDGEIRRHPGGALSRARD